MTEDIHWRKYSARFRTFPKLIDGEMDQEVKMVICIPVCAEPDILSALESLMDCEFHAFKVEVIILFNGNSMFSPQELEQHKQSWLACTNWVSQHQKEGIKFLPVYLDLLPDPEGGVGWARKIAMDEAARRLDPQGIIVCLDADCTVSGNYLQAIFQHFQDHKSCDAASICIEHKLDHLGSNQRAAIIEYELHLRYLINAQHWCGHPFAYHTIGSAMAVRRKAYLDQGGMNTRRAGEDFYFLQKFIEVGGHMEINNAIVYPSARVSSRVPFGTGRAMQQILDKGEEWITTDFEIFRSIKPLFHSLEKLRSFCMTNTNNDYQKLQIEFELSEDIIHYLEQTEFIENCRSIAKHTASHQAFRKRFFRYFNAFRMIKYMHHLSDHFHPGVYVVDGVERLAKEMKWVIPDGSNAFDYLKLLRQTDREGNRNAQVKS